MNSKRKKNFTCSLCNKAFIDNAHLKDHEVNSFIQLNSRLSTLESNHLSVNSAINDLLEVGRCVFI